MWEKQNKNTREAGQECRRSEIRVRERQHKGAEQLDKALEPFRPVVYDTTLDAAQAVNAAKATLKKLSGK